MNDRKNIINGYILAGGKSSRMGTDKGLLLLNGKLIIQHVIEQLQPTVQKVVIVSNNTDYDKTGLEVIGDIIKDIGPAGGIYTALSHSTTKYNFVVSCDMPFISSYAIDYVIQHSFQSQITLPILQEKIEPLFGVYSKDCLLKWEELIGKGIIKLQTLINNFDTLQLDVTENDLFNEVLFANINTKNDLESAIKIIADEH